MGRRLLQPVVVFAIVCGLAALYWFWRSTERTPDSRPASALPLTKALPAPDPVAPPPAQAAPESESHLADDLNAPGGTIRRDLEILNELFATWQTNFPRSGNPVGENVEITAALVGENPLRFAFMSRRHRAINSRGELCDRWGTPFRFHQLSGQQMEIRSAGPDRKFGTADDVFWSPPP